MRIVIVEDSGFFLDLLTDSLRGRGIDVVARAATRPEALRLIDDLAPDLVLLDIRLTEARDTEGLDIAELARKQYPDVGLLMLSDYLESAYAERLLCMEEVPRAIGYLGKERLGNLDELVDAFNRVARGEVVIDAYIISKLMSRRRIADPLDKLTPHERRILALVAEGRSNRGIAQKLDTKISTVEKQLSTINHKLDLPEAAGAGGLNWNGSLYNQRVLAALTFLRSSSAAQH